MPVRETAVYAALALAGHYFPRAAGGDSRGAAPFDQAAFLLSGKYQAWDRWQELSHEEKQRIAMVCSIAPAELANVRKFSVAARSLLAQLGADESGDAPAMAPFEIAGDSPFTADVAFGRLGGDPLGYVDRLTARFRRPSARPKPPEFAGPGTWLTGEIFVKNVGQVHGRLTIPAYPQFTEAPGHDSLPRVSTVPYLASLRIPTPELLGLAEKIDQRYPQDSRYLHRTLEQLFSVLQTTDTVTPAEALTLAAGGMEIFNAPTGTGKSVLVRVMAAWFAARSLRVAIVLPDIKACLAMTWNVRGDLAHLHSSGGIAHEPACAHLMSASSMHDRAVKLASLISEAPDAPGEWGERAERDVDPLAYGCAQKTFLEATGDYPPSREPCFSLRRQGTGSVACPWIPTCGKYAPVYEAAAASVIIMNHYMFMQGNLRIGVNLDGLPVHGMTAAELALRDLPLGPHRRGRPVPVPGHRQVRQRGGPALPPPLVGRTPGDGHRRQAAAHRRRARPAARRQPCPAHGRVPPAEHLHERPQPARPGGRAGRRTRPGPDQQPLAPGARPGPRPSPAAVAGRRRRGRRHPDRALPAAQRTHARPLPAP